MCSRLPDPRSESTPWAEFILRDSNRWASVAMSVFFYESQCDRRRAESDGASSDARAQTGTELHSCKTCVQSFPSSKSLKAHMRRKHGVRCLQRLHAEANGVCPVCRTDFHTRLRCLAHLCDFRRTRCWNAILLDPNSFPPLPLDRVAALDEIDKDFKREAWRSGHSHVIASGSAVTVAGKRVGHVS